MISIEPEPKQGWQCPCCKLIWAPGQQFCWWCSQPGQGDENVKKWHRCPTFEAVQ
jgi:hypothetical protein